MKKLALALSIILPAYAQEASIDNLTKAICTTNLAEVEKILPDITLSDNQQIKLILIALQRKHYLLGMADAVSQEVRTAQKHLLLIAAAAAFLSASVSKSVRESHMYYDPALTFLEVVMAGTSAVVAILGIKCTFSFYTLKKELAHNKALKDAIAIKQLLTQYKASTPKNQ